MEQWERDIITENLSKLITITDCKTLILSKLKEKKVLGLDDMEDLEAIIKKLERAKALYDLIVKKHNGFRILIETFLEPEVSQDAPAILLIQKAKEIGKGHGLPELPSQKPSSATTPDTVDSSLPTQGGNERQIQAQLPEELEKFVCDGKPLEVNVIQPNEQALTEKPKYLLRQGKNFAFILNIIEIDGQLERKGAEMDTDYMVSLLEALGYEIFPKKRLLYGGRWNKQIIDDELEEFKSLCIQNDVDSMVVFLGSHGCESHLMTSDGQWLDVNNEVIYKLQFQQKNADNSVKSVAKIFINESCQIDLRPGVPSSPPLPSCEDTIHILAQMPKYESSRVPDCGSFFVIVLVYVLMTRSWNTSLTKMLEESQNLLEKMSQRAGRECFQVNPFTIIGLKTPFYFFPR